MNILIAIAATATLLISINSQAALVSTDLVSVGDGLITLDTDTGLKWLDLTQTRGWSYDSVNLQLGAGGRFEGFRFATSREASQLWGNGGARLPYYSYDAYTDSIVGMIGDTMGLSGMYLDTLVGALGLVQGNGGLTMGGDTYTYIYGRSTNLCAYPCGDTSEYSWRVIGPEVDDRIGSYLVAVTPVPVPAAIWLFGSGLIGLIGFARRK